MASAPNHPRLGRLLDIIVDEIPCSTVMALLTDDDRRVILKESPMLSPSEDKDINADIIKKALEEKHPVFINNFCSSPGSGGSKNEVKSIVCFPLFVEDKPVGVLYLERKSPARPLSGDNLEFLAAISKPVSFFLKSLPEFQETRDSPRETCAPFFGGQSKAFRRILTLIDRVKDSDASVFILGESGTGKELVARTIHKTGARRSGKFVAVNCGAIPDFLLESELFGYAKGAFTGAVRDKPGLVEEADRGTFFLDEIGDLSLHLQAKLLRVLQDKEIRRIGENKSRIVDVRFISATNKDIDQEIERGNFREDLYYRLKIITIEAPPLRERKEDLFFLMNHFIEKYCREMKRERAYLSPGSLEMMVRYSWPGNIRELQNEIQRCLILAGEDHFIREEHLSPKINPRRESFHQSSYDFFKAKAEFEKRFLNQALSRWNYNRVKTAEEIGLSRQGLFKLIKKHKIDIPKKDERNAEVGKS